MDNNEVDVNNVENNTTDVNISNNKPKKNNKNLIIIIGAAVILLCLIIFGFIFLGSNKGDSNTDKSQDDSNIEISGTYEDKGLTIKLLKITDIKAYSLLEKGDTFLVNSCEINNYNVKCTNQDLEYTFNISKDNLDFTTNDSRLENGSYKRKGEYTAETFYGNIIGNPDLLKTKYSGSFELNGISLLMYSPSDAQIVLSISKTENDDVIEYDSAFYSDIKNKNSNVFISVDGLSTLKVDEGSVVFNTESKDYKIFNGTYTKKSDMTVENVIDNFLKY